DDVLGLSIVGGLDAGLGQLTQAIIAEKRERELRVASVENILALAELMERYDVTHEDVLALLRPGGPLVDQMVGLIGRVAAEETDPEAERIKAGGEAAKPGRQPAEGSPAEPLAVDRLYLMTPVSDE